MEETEPLLIHRTRPSRWTWRILADQVAVAMSGRTFETERQATRALDAFCFSAMHAAAIPDVLRLPAPRQAPFSEPVPGPSRGWRL